LAVGSFYWLICRIRARIKGFTQLLERQTAKIGASQMAFCQGENMAVGCFSLTPLANFCINI
jgi:hypothetical protein